MALPKREYFWRGLRIVAVCATLTTAPLLAQENVDKKAAARKPQIQWEKDLDQAWALSAKDGRPVLAYFTFET